MFCASSISSSAWLIVKEIDPAVFASSVRGNTSSKVDVAVLNLYCLARFCADSTLEFICKINEFATVMSAPCKPYSSISDFADNILI